MIGKASASFYVGNHNSTAGIGDWIRNFGKIFGWHDVPLVVSSRLDSCSTVIVLDEFSNRNFTDAFIRWSIERPKDSTLFLAFSEFMDVGSNGKLRLNVFESWTRQIRPNAQMIRRPRSKIVEPFTRSRYLAKRAEGLEDVMKRARIDAYVSGHPAISQQIQDLHHLWGLEAVPILDAEHPALIQDVFHDARVSPSGVLDSVSEFAGSFDDDLEFVPRSGKNERKLTFRFSWPVLVQGFATPYRRSILKKLSKKGVLLANPSQVKDFRLPETYWGFDFAIPRTSTWPFVSPFRLLRAHYQGLIPLALETWWPDDQSKWRGLCVFTRDIESAVRCITSKDLADLFNGTLDQRHRLVLEFGLVSETQWSNVLHSKLRSTPGQ